MLTLEQKQQIMDELNEFHRPFIRNIKIVNRMHTELEKINEAGEMLQKSKELEEFRTVLGELVMQVAALVQHCSDKYPASNQVFHADFLEISWYQKSVDEKFQRISNNIDMLMPGSEGYQHASDVQPDSRPVYSMRGFIAHRQVFRDYYTPLGTRGVSEPKKLIQVAIDLCSQKCHVYVKKSAMAAAAAAAAADLVP
jgi:hypothetical protein